MTNESVILIAEDDPGHAGLIRKNLRRAGVTNGILHFKDGQEILDFLFNQDNLSGNIDGGSYVLLLDIRMPKIDGFEVIQTIKEHAELRKMPVIVITTTDDPREVERCHMLGCNNYISKPVSYDNFVNAMQQLGRFLSVTALPVVNRRVSI